MTRLVKLFLAVVVGCLALSSCSFDVYKLPLPGGTDVGSDAITVTADFEDVLDLVPKSTVKVDDVSVGEVTDISLVGYHAVVTMKLRNDTKLPDNPVAQIQQTSLLGEKFVSLSAPSSGAEGSLKSGDNIPLAQTGRDPEVEEVLGALSLLLNGGGVAQLKTISEELNNALGGREDAARSVLDQINTLTTTLDDNKGDIVDAIDALNRLSISVHDQEGNIDAALQELPGALTSINSQRADLVKMLQALAQLGNVGVRVIDASKQATIDSLTQLQPVLTELANSGGAFVKAFNVFLTYPFVDEVVGRDPQVARNLQMGDYTNLDIQLDLNLTQGLPTNPTDILPTNLDPSALVNAALACITSGNLSSQACLQLLNTVGGLAQLKTECQKPANQNKTVCVVLNTIPALPALPGGGLASALPSNPLSSVLTGVTGALGLNRAQPWADATHGGPTMGQLETVFDPSLVSLLVSPMVATPAAPAKAAATKAKKGSGAQ